MLHSLERRLDRDEPHQGELGELFVCYSALGNMATGLVLRRIVTLIALYKWSAGRSASRKERQGWGPDWQRQDTHSAVSTPRGQREGVAGAGHRRSPPRCTTRRPGDVRAPATLCMGRSPHVHAPRSSAHKAPARVLQTCTCLTTGSQRRHRHSTWRWPPRSPASRRSQPTASRLGTRCST